MSEGIVLGYENEIEMKKAYDQLIKIKKDYFDILTYFEPYPWVDLRFFIVLAVHPGFLDELENLIKVSKIDFGDVVKRSLSDVAEDIEKMEPFEFAEERQPIVIGKDIPIVSGEREFVKWELYTGVARVETFDSFKDAIKEYPYYFDTYLRDIKDAIEKGKIEKEGAYKTGNSPPMLCPLYKYEQAIMNPYVVGWDDCILPLVWVKTEKECNNYEGEFIDGTCVIPFPEVDQNEWNQDKFRLKELNRNFIFELAKKREVPVIIKENVIEVPQVYYGNRLVKWKVVKIWEHTDKKIYPTDYKTFDDALKDYNKYFAEYLEAINKAKEESKDKEKFKYWVAQALKDFLPIIYPFYYSEKRNREFYYGDLGLLPLTFVETKEECKSFEGTLYQKICIRKFTSTDSWDWYHETDGLWLTPEYKGKFKSLMTAILKLVELYDVI